MLPGTEFPATERTGNMRDLIESVEFWIAMVVVSLIKLRASPQITPLGRVLTVATAVGCALVFTEPVLTYLALDAQAYRTGVAALLALTGEHITRQLLGVTLSDIFGAWRGKK